MRVLTDLRRQAYDKQGYVAIDEFLDPAEVAATLDEISAIADMHPNVPHGLVQLEPAVEAGEFKPESFELGIRKLFRMAVHNDYFRRLAEHPLFVEVATDLLGPDVTMLQSMTLVKPPYCGSIKRWHQDNAYFQLDPPRVVGFWVALDEATADNGCMHVVPGSHAAGAVPHVPDPELHIPIERIDHERVIPVPLAPGAALVFDGLLHHFTPPNRSPHRRRALQLHYVDSHCRFATDTPWVAAEVRVSGATFEGCV